MEERFLVQVACWEGEENTPCWEEGKYSMFPRLQSLIRLKNMKQDCVCVLTDTFQVLQTFRRPEIGFTQPPEQIE